ncbi:hypothetical protein HMPREF0577_1345 [Mobiluncus mulieris ATCC 35243]|nr:hypothetical protein HMPREF0577_1345 [Mobiluncus mulieris ATCC 35243]
MSRVVQRVFRSCFPCSRGASRQFSVAGVVYLLIPSSQFVVNPAVNL